jgi:Subtilase family
MATRRRGDASRKLPRTIYAQASPTSVGGTSLFAGDRAVTGRTVARFRSEPKVVRRAADRLRRAGFKVLQVSDVTINIAGSASLYERTFKTKLVTEERTVLKERRRRDKATYIDAADTDVRGLIDTSKSALADVIEGVAIEEPVYYHAAPLPFPPPKKYWHLDVPGDVSLGANADRVHREGHTGLGVKLMMVDSGWFRHPYFERRGYRGAPVELAPGATNPDKDESGHGTGESANAFATAPDVDFTMVKMGNVNPTAAFNYAVSLAPQVISCSWGFDQPVGPLPAALQALAASVAQAVASGIVVVFSAGNGQYGFPGQHPDVISAGGVFMKPNGELRASNYASGFASQIYSGRKVPDVSGLVGMQPSAAYIMLPVEPGDEIDVALGGGKHPQSDETKATDGWAAISGTSAAAPQIAGVCALIKEACPTLSPADVRKALKQSARDVKEGKNIMGEQASAGYDLATGAGLVDAYGAVERAKQLCGP